MTETTNSLISLLLLIGIMVGTYKLAGYFYQWVEYKWGQETKRQTITLVALLALIAIFLWGSRTVGFVILGVHLTLVGLTHLIGTIAHFKLRKLLIKDYIAIEVELYRLKKIGWDKSMKADKLYDMANKIWEVLDEKAHTEIKNLIPSAIDSWEKAQVSD